MDSRQKKVLLYIMGFALLAWSIFSFATSKREPDFPLSKNPLLFNAADAYRVTQEFVTGNPRRVLGSIESRQSTAYLHDYLEKFGYQVSYSHFDAQIGKRKEVGRNILAFKQGQTGEIIVLVAHYDTARTTVQGAMENGAAVGVLLELARILASKPTRRSILLAFSDGEEWGMLGTQELATAYPQRDRIIAALSLDHVSVGDLAAVCFQATGQTQGFSPPWLRQIAAQAARASDLPVLAPSGLREHFERALLISLADHGPFLKEGIPAINLGSKSTDRRFEKAVYHSPEDKIDNLKLSSFEQYGRAAERILYSLDDPASIPPESSGFFRLGNSLYFHPTSITVLHVILFLPPVLMLFFCLKNYRKELSAAVIGREALIYLATAFPFLVFYFLIGLCRALLLLPTYNLYPPKDPLLENPNWGVLGAILGTALFVAIICCAAVIFSHRRVPKPDYYASKIVLLGIAVILILISLFYNSYWATLFLVVPTWIWALAGRGEKVRSKAARWAWMIAAGIPYYIFLWVLGSQLGLSWNLIWYQVLALNSGMFTSNGFFLGVAAIALGIRFLAIQARAARSLPRLGSVTE
jgi:hypothetical protein